LLRCGGLTLRPRPAPSGRVLEVDLRRNRIRIDAQLDAGEAFHDAVVFLGNDLHQESYTIRHVEVEGDSTWLDFGSVLCRVGMGEVAETNGGEGTVTSDRPLRGYGRLEGGRHEGRWLFNDAMDRGFRITAIEGKTFRLEGRTGDLEQLFADANDDGRRQYWISDVGPGDSYRISAVTCYAK